MQEPEFMDTREMLSYLKNKLIKLERACLKYDEEGNWKMYKKKSEEADKVFKDISKVMLQLKLEMAELEFKRED